MRDIGRWRLRQGETKKHHGFTHAVLQTDLLESNERLCIITTLRSAALLNPLDTIIDRAVDMVNVDSQGIQGLCVGMAGG